MFPGVERIRVIVFNPSPPTPYRLKRLRLNGCAVLHQVFTGDDDLFITRQPFRDFYQVAATGTDLNIHSLGFPLSDDIEILRIF